MLLSIPSHLRILPLRECTKEERELCRFASRISGRDVFLATTTDADTRDYSDGERTIILVKDYVKVAIKDLAEGKIINAYISLLPSISHHLAHKKGETEEAHNTPDYWKRVVEVQQKMLVSFFREYTEKISSSRFSGVNNKKKVIIGNYMRLIDVHDSVASKFMESIKACLPEDREKFTVSYNDGIVVICIINPTKSEYRKLQDVVRNWEGIYPGLIYAHNGQIVEQDVKK